jgi:hypothetical protein
MIKTTSLTPDDFIDRIIPLVVCLIVLYMVFLACVNSIFGIEDSATIYLFEPDGAFAVRQMQVSFKYNELDPWGHYNYGNIYNSIGFALLKVTSSLGYEVQQVPFIAYTLRYISIVSYVLMLLVFYATLRISRVPSALSSIFTLILASPPELYFHAQTIHPDSLTLLLITCTVFVFVYRQNFSALLLSILFVGLAFGTKYTGIFLLPFLPLPYMYNILRSNANMTNRIAKIFGTGVLVVSIFFLIWLITNPSVIANYQELARDVATERWHLTQQFGNALATNPFSWFLAFYDQFTFTGSVVILTGMLCGILATFLKLKGNPGHVSDVLTLKKSCAPQTCVIACLVFYVLANFGYFFFTVSARGIRYLFHIFPALIWLAVLGMAWVYKNFLSSKWRAIVACVLLGLTAPLSFHALSVNSYLSNKPQNDFLVAGRWLTQNYSSSTKVLYELHGYIPQQYFQNFLNVEYITEQAIQAFDPDVIIFNQRALGQWSQVKKGHDLQGGVPIPTNVPKDHVEFCRNFFAPDNTQWRIVYEVPTLVILEKTRK